MQISVEISELKRMNDLAEIPSALVDQNAEIIPQKVDNELSETNVKPEFILNLPKYATQTRRRAIILSSYNDSLWIRLARRKLKKTRQLAELG